MDTDIIMGSIIKIMIYLALIFGCFFIYLYDVQAISMYLLMGAWIGFIALFIAKKIDKLITLKMGQPDEREPKKILHS